MNWPHAFDVYRDIGTLPATYDDYGHRVVTVGVLQFRFYGWLQPYTSHETESAPDAGTLIDDARIYCEPVPLLAGDRLRNVDTNETWRVDGIVDMGGLSEFLRVGVRRFVL